MKKEITMVTAGILIGATLASPAAGAVSELFTAQRVTYPVYVDGRSVDLDAYAIDGRTYVQLRELGRAAGFNVYWNSAVQIQSGTAYTGEAPPAVDYAAQADPAIFQGQYTKELYNAFREVILKGKSSSYSREKLTTQAFWEVDAAATAYSDYQIRYEDDGLVSLYTREPLEHHVKAEVALRPFLNSVAGKSDYEKLYAAACLICEKLDYDAKSTTVPSDLFTTDGIHYGNCMSYAHAFRYLCTLMDIPCILVHSEIHQWNGVWLNGKWEPMDLTSFEIGYTERGYDNLLSDPQDWQGKIFTQTEPELARFAKEVLVPGSTK